jgi:hypothetical protein
MRPPAPSLQPRRKPPALCPCCSLLMTPRSNIQIRPEMDRTEKETSAGARGYSRTTWLESFVVVHLGRVVIRCLCPEIRASDCLKSLYLLAILGLAW